MDFGMLSEKQTKDMMRFLVGKASWETWVQLYRNAIIRDEAQGRKTTDLTPVKEEVTLWKTTEKGKSLNFLEIHRLVLSLCVVAEWPRETVLGWRGKNVYRAYGSNSSPVVWRETADNQVVKALVRYCFCGLRFEKITFGYYLKYKVVHSAFLLQLYIECPPLRVIAVDFF